MEELGFQMRREVLELKESGNQLTEVGRQWREVKLQLLGEGGQKGNWH